MPWAYVTWPGKENERRWAAIGARHGWPIMTIPKVPTSLMPAFQDGETEWLVPLVAVHDEDEDCEGQLILECLDLPPEESWLGFQISEDGYAFLTEDQSVLEFCLENGIAPGQRFYASVSASSSRSYYGEYDEWWAAAVVWVETLSDFGHERAWEEWLMRFGESEQKYNDRRATFAARCAVESTWFVLVDWEHRYAREGERKIQATLVSAALDVSDYYHQGLPRVSEIVVDLGTNRYAAMHRGIVDAGWGKYPLIVKIKDTAIRLFHTVCGEEGLPEQYSRIMEKHVTEHGPIRGTSYLLPSFDRMVSEWKIVDGEDRLKPYDEEEDAA